MHSVQTGPAHHPIQSPAAKLRALLLLTLALSIFAIIPAHGQTAPVQRPIDTIIPVLGAAIPSTHLLTAVETKTAITPPTIVIGFLGGRVKQSNTVHREVQVAMRLRLDHPVGVYAEVFQNDHGQVAFNKILQLLDINHDGSLTLAEKQRARIILYGHSWGASETVTMAHQLQDAGIPVMLTVLIDRVSKIGEGDDRIPANVAEAVNFYELNGFLHGHSTIRAEDPARTHILGNYQFDYKENHVDCDQFPWYARAFMGPHIEIENDPRVWNQVESLIAAKLPPETSKTIARITH